MNFLLKIVEGPNKGAEIALVEGVAVTLGKSDDCDIVLADATLPDAPLSIEATAYGVSVGGEPLEPFAVKTAGATSFAIGPADAQWGELQWPSKEAPKEGDTPSGVSAEASAKAEAPAKEEGKPQGEQDASASGAKEETDGKPQRRGFLGCFLMLVALLLVLAGIVWFFWAQLRPHAEKAWDGMARMVGCARTTEVSPVAPPVDIKSIAEKYGLTLTDRTNGQLLSGNLSTRAERLAATAEAYAVQPGIDLDLSDDESFRTAAEDALFTLTEGALKVASATNRALSVVGASHSAAALKRTLVALNADLPKLRSIDVSRVKFGSSAVRAMTEEVDGGMPVASDSAPLPAPKKRSHSASFPVCGIMTKPYPCLVMRNGARILEGAPFGDGVILKIGADSVVISNSTGRITWKP